MSPFLVLFLFLFLFNKVGEMIIEPTFDDVFDFEDGVCKVELIDGDPADNLSRFGYIDTQGNYIWEPTR